MFEIVCSKPSFNLSLRRGFSDASENMFDPVPVAVIVETGFSSPHTPELRSMIGEDLSGLDVFVDCLVE